MQKGTSYNLLLFKTDNLVKTKNVDAKLQSNRFPARPHVKIRLKSRRNMPDFNL